ncbi:hypothetical protein PVAND_015974 [Polypedilum vanderplanki]|uniref:Uncharacterized protein n=1 Tax=Polypedilum vanderplanki TaxID=319348 RepID=A0A9J6BDR9_POLVA|nr:hypothetical protein PVAND_015974 [Polypedilum vanderplanki]
MNRKTVLIFFFVACYFSINNASGNIDHNQIKAGQKIKTINNKDGTQIKNFEESTRNTKNNHGLNTNGNDYDYADVILEYQEQQCKNQCYAENNGKKVIYNFEEAYVQEDI